MKLIWLDIIVLVTFTSSKRITWRSDGRCGEEHRLRNGSPGECNPHSFNPCCSSEGYCGSTKSHCSCARCIDYRKDSDTYPKWRTDKRCGANYPLPNGDPTECEGGGEYPCCSDYGWCGASIMHCECKKCVNYGKPFIIDDRHPRGRVLWRRDLKCGWRYPLPNNGGVSQCDPDSYTPCCASTGHCGATKLHCACPDCVDYRRKTEKYRRWRADKICGENYPLPDGRATECNPDSSHPCCSNYGFCGASPAHCDCANCVDYRRQYGSNAARVSNNNNCQQNVHFYHGKFMACDPDSERPCCSRDGICGASRSHCTCAGCIDSRDPSKEYPKWRSDKRCGKNYPLPGENRVTECDPNSDNPCCSGYGFCGGSKKHCLCKKCVDYRVYASTFSRWRTDKRCGKNFPLPNKEPTECDPRSDNPCCSKEGYCGRSDLHCSCAECEDYRM